MSGLNKVMGIGYLGADSELRHTQNGNAVLSFRVAVTEKWKDGSGNPQEHTEWLRCVLWGKRAEALAQHLTQGTRVYVEGSMRTSKYTDKDGVDRYKVEINVRELELLGGGARDQQRQQQGGQGQQRGGYQQNQGGGYGGNQHGRQQQGGGQQRGGYGGRYGGGSGSPPQRPQRSYGPHANEDFEPPPDDDFTDNIPF